MAAGQNTSKLQQATHIRTVASDTIADLAVAVADPARPVIYYNPRLMERFGPLISTFVLAHERAHIELGHVRPKSGWDSRSLEQLLQGWELAADCHAATRLAREQPTVLQAAIDFFLRMGPDQIDREHPSGNARAAQLQACGSGGPGDRSRSSEGPRISASKIQFR